MSLTITITDLTNLTDTERAVLRFVADRATAESLMETVRGMCTGDAPAPPMEQIDDCARAAPVEPEEAYSPHTIVGDAPSVPAPSGTSAELDTNGLPWDKRIHSSSRAKVADGTWRKMRGVDDALVVTVEAELRAVQAIPVPVQPYSTMTSAQIEAENAATAESEEEAMRNNAEDSTAQIVPLPPAMVRELESTGHLAPLPPTAPAPMTFAQLMQHLTPMLVSGKLTQPMLQQVVGSLGLPHLAALGARPDLVETVRAAIDEVVGGVQ